MFSPSIDRLATADKLLVVSDFDGTLAGFHTDIYAVPVNQRSIGSLERLAALADTHVAVLSGRHLEGLAKVCPLGDPIIMAGSHGNESTVAGEPTPEQAAVLDEVDRALSAILTVEGSGIERKPFQRVAHVLELAQRDAAAAEELLTRIEAIDVPGARITHGKNIIEFSVTDVTKGTWIAETRDRLGVDATVFIGDDVTDEDGFAVLGPHDVGIKVGPGDTRASERVDDLDAVATWLAALADAREAQLARR